MIDILNQQLPQIREVALRCEADYYGASYLVAEQLGVGRPPQSIARWAHGWVYEPISHFRQISDWQAPSELKLVANESHAALVSSNDHPAIAVGLPYLYTSEPDVKRIPGSLLVMPPHVTDHSFLAINEMDYVEEIFSLKSRFSHIVACVSRHCIQKEYWTKSFEAFDIPWIPGAYIRDASALTRMRMLFSNFEFMTTNTMGSHIVYAAYAGCRPSLFGPLYMPQPEEFVRDPFYLRYPELLELEYSRSSPNVLRKHYPELFCEPHTAKCLKDWAFAEMGGGSMKPPSEIARLLGWNRVDQIRLLCAKMKGRILGILNQ